MRISPFAMPMLVLVALFGTVFTAQATGQWSTSGRVAIDPTKMTAADLKGWMTLQDVMTGLQISQAHLYAAGKIPADVPPGTALNKLESLVPGFSVSMLREALTAKPPDPSASELVVPTASAPTPNVSSAPSATGTDGGTGPTPVPAGQILPADQIKGRMTLKEVSTQCAVPLDTLRQKLNLGSDTSSDIAIKDLITQGKVSEVTDVQKRVAELQGN